MGIFCLLCFLVFVGTFGFLCVKHIMTCEKACPICNNTKVTELIYNRKRNTYYCMNCGTDYSAVKQLETE